MFEVVDLNALYVRFRCSVCGNICARQYQAMTPSENLVIDA